MASRAAAAAAGIHCFAPRFPWRGFAADATPTAAWSRPLLPRPAAGSSRPHLLRRGLAAITGDHSPGLENMPRSWFDPEAPVDPSTCFDYGEEDLASDEALWALYERWCAFHGVRRGRDDMLRRFGDFKDRARRIRDFNNSGASYTKGLNEFGDETAEERAKLFSQRRRYV